MNIKQISVFLENKKGRLAEVTDVLTKARVNIRALILADTADFGVLRMIVNDPDRSQKVLKDAGFVVKETDVIAVEVEDKPGGLHRILDVLGRSGINVEYMYATVEKSKESAFVVFKIDEQEKAIEMLRKNGISLLKSETLKSL